MRRQAVVVALLAGGIALLGPAAAPMPASAGVGSAGAAADAVAVPAVVAPAGAADDTDDGLKAEAKTTFVVDPPARKIHVTTNVTLTNQVADVNRGNVVEQYYFYQYAVPVLSEAEGAHAQRSDGTALTVNLHASEDAAQQWVKFAQVDLAPRLLFGQSQAITLTYDLPYQAPRSAGLSRANDALVTFPAFSAGDAGLTSIEVRLPSTFSVEVVGDPLDQQQRDGQTVLTAGPIQNPDTFTAIVVATDDDRLVSKDIQVEGRDVEVRAWPDDADWATFVADQLGATMPALEGLIGQPWPTERGLDVVETASPYAHGYAGWYSQVDHSISLGDELDPLVIAHELSHVWFNANLFDARWINEGLADEYAQTTLQQLHKPTPDAAVPDRNGPGAVSLNDWSTPSLLEQQDDATEAYGYAASWYVMDQVAAEIGVDKMRDVIDAVTREQLPYPGDPDDPHPATVDGVANWQRLLDQLENVGGSRRATELFGTYVANDSQKPTLAARTQARLAYAGLAERGGEWSPPVFVRGEMSGWDFDKAGAEILQANAVLDVRDDIDAVLEGHDVGHLALEDSYEQSDDLTALGAEADETLDAARAYRDADDRMDRGAGLIGAVGLLGSGTDGQLDEAADQLAGGDAEASLDASASVEDHLDSASRNGLLRLAGLLVVLGGLAWVIRHRRGEERRRQRTAEAEIAQLEAMYARRPASSPPAGDAAWRHVDPDHPN
ncbi:MAG TPA: hypothetical protein VGO78_25885 [Acidimicrobiales bacterium]|nr:hypothetical protein [Acidimicrobiales bacterium]